MVNISISAAQATHDEIHYKKVQKTGFSPSGGTSIGYGTSKLTNTNDSQQVTNVGSTVGSVQGDVTINSGKTYTQTGSDILTPQGDINITAQKVNIAAATDTYANQQTMKYKQTGLTLAITSPVISAIQTVQQMSQAASNTSDGRMQALAAGSAALAVNNALNALPDQYGNVATAGNTGAKDMTNIREANAADQVGGINVSLSIGTSKSSSSSQQTSTTAKSSTLNAAGNINITATGAGKDSDINVIGSQIKAAHDVTLKAEGEINLQAAQNVDTLKSTNKGSSASLGVSFGTDGLLFTAGLSGSKGNTKGNGSTWTETVIQGGNKAGDTVTLQSGTDTNVIGSQVIGNQIIANVGTSGTGNLNIQSLQDTNQYKDKQQSIGGSISVGYGKMGGSFNYSDSKTKSNYASVNEQAGFFAGAEGFQVNVNGNTNLTGAVMASTDTAIQDHKNSLTTQTLTISNIENKAEYKASSTSIGGGYSTSGDNVGFKNPNATGSVNTATNMVGTNQQGQATTGALATSRLPSLGGFSASLPVALKASDSADSTTVSGISGGTITITRPEAQQKIDEQKLAEAQAKAKQAQLIATQAAQQTQLAAAQQRNAGILGQGGNPINHYLGNQSGTTTDIANTVPIPSSYSTVAMLNRDVHTQISQGTDAQGNPTTQITAVDSQGNNLASTIAPIFTEETKAEIQAGFEITQAFTGQVGTFLNNRAKEAEAAQHSFDNAVANGASNEELTALTLQMYDSQKWLPGGTYNTLTTAFLGALSGNITGSTSQLLQGAAVNYLQSLAVSEVKKIADNLQSETARAALQAVVGCAGAGAAASGNNCGTGAVSAASAVVLSNLLDTLATQKVTDLSATEQLARRDLLLTIITGISGNLGAEAQTALIASQLEIENNQLGKNRQVQTAMGYVLGVGASIGSLAAIATPEFWQGMKLIKDSDHPLDLLTLALKSEAKERGQNFDMFMSQNDMFGAGMVTGRSVADTIMIADAVGSLATLSVKVAQAGGTLISNGVKYTQSIVNGATKIVAEVVVVNKQDFVLVGETQYVGSSKIQQNTTIALNQAVKLNNGQELPVGTVVTVSGDAMKATLPDGSVIKGNYAKLTAPELNGLGGVVSIDDVGMQFGKGIQGQGKPFEGYVQTHLPEGTLDLNTIKSNFSTFDHLTPDGTAVSTKTMDTVGSVTYQNPSSITRVLNGYVDDMVGFTGDDEKVGIPITSDMISAKQMQLAIPFNTTSEQMAAIAKSIEYAANLPKPIKIVVTRIK